MRSTFALPICLLCAATYAQDALPVKLDLPGLHNVLKVSVRIYSGSEPHGDAGFESLARLGIKTVVSVDGARPDVEAARQHRLKYVHIPIGYDGVSAKAGQSLARLVREADAPFYIHCHHGQHRGPAAAAVACVASGASDAPRALTILELAGTGKNYTGLWRDVANYRPPAKTEKLPELVEVAEVESLAAAMAQIDRHFDHLKLCQMAQWQSPPDHPDVVATQEALILREGLRESVRHSTSRFDARFKIWLAEAEAESARLENALKGGDRSIATKCLSSLDASCKQCHTAYRNQGSK